MTHVSIVTGKPHSSVKHRILLASGHYKLGRKRAVFKNVLIAITPCTFMPLPLEDKNIVDIAIILSSGVMESPN